MGETQNGEISFILFLLSFVVEFHQITSRVLKKKSRRIAYIHSHPKPSALLTVQKATSNTFFTALLQATVVTMATMWLYYTVSEAGLCSMHTGGEKKKKAKKCSVLHFTIMQMRKCRPELWCVRPTLRDLRVKSGMWMCSLWGMHQTGVKHSQSQEYRTLQPLQWKEKNVSPVKQIKLSGAAREKKNPDNKYRCYSLMI